jgi:hypothetical protein
MDILPEAVPLGPSLRYDLRRRAAAVRWVLLGMLVGLGLLGGGAVVVQHVHSASRVAAVRMQPTGQQLPLLVTATSSATLGVPAFRIRLPEQPRWVDGPASTDGSRDLLVAPIHGRSLGALLVVRFGPNVPVEPKAALSAMRRSLTRMSSTFSYGPVLSTTVAGHPALTMQVHLSRWSDEQEFRFVVNGAAVGVGIVHAPGDQVTLDTALAALQTWQWMS